MTQPARPRSRRRLDQPTPTIAADERPDVEPEPEDKGEQHASPEPSPAHPRKRRRTGRRLRVATRPIPPGDA